MNNEAKPLSQDVESGIKDLLGEHGCPEDRSSTEVTANFISRRKDSATSAVTQTQAQKAFTK